MYFLARLKDLSEDTWLGPLVAEGGEAQSTFDLYLTSLYLSVVTFCTVGEYDCDSGVEVAEVFTFYSHCFGFHEKDTVILVRTMRWKNFLGASSCY